MQQIRNKAFSNMHTLYFVEHGVCAYDVQRRKCYKITPPDYEYSVDDNIAPFENVLYWMADGTVFSIPLPVSQKPSKKSAINEITDSSGKIRIQKYRDGILIAVEENELPLFFLKAGESDLVQIGKGCGKEEYVSGGLFRDGYYSRYLGKIYRIGNTVYYTCKDCGENRIRKVSIDSPMQIITLPQKDESGRDIDLVFMLLDDVNTVL